MTRSGIAETAWLNQGAATAASLVKNNEVNAASVHIVELSNCFEPAVVMQHVCLTLTEAQCLDLLDLMNVLLDTSLEIGDVRKRS